MAGACCTRCTSARYQRGLTSPMLPDNSKLQLGNPLGPGVPFSAVLASEDVRVRRRAAAAMVPLLEALGFLLLRGGCFHADPHAGNLLLQARPRRWR